MRIEITKQEDLRAGDVATFSYEGHEFSGEVWQRAEDAHQYKDLAPLRLGQSILTHSQNTFYEYITFVSAYREVELPTKPYAIVAAPHEGLAGERMIYVRIDIDPNPDVEYRWRSQQGLWVTSEDVADAIEKDGWRVVFEGVDE